MRTIIRAMKKLTTTTMQSMMNKNIHKFTKRTPITNLRNMKTNHPAMTMLHPKTMINQCMKVIPKIATRPESEICPFSSINFLARNSLPA